MESIGWRVPDVHALTHAVGWKSSHTFKASQDDGDDGTGHWPLFTFGMEKHNKSRCVNIHQNTSSLLEASKFRYTGYLPVQSAMTFHLKSQLLYDRAGCPFIERFNHWTKNFQEFVSFNYNLTLTIKLWNPYPDVHF